MPNPDETPVEVAEETKDAPEATEAQEEKPAPLVRRGGFAGMPSAEHLPDEDE